MKRWGLNGAIRSMGGSGRLIVALVAISLTDVPTPGRPVRPGVFLVALDDAGKSGDAIGCGDSVVPIEREIPPSSNQLKAALEALFSIGSDLPEGSGLHNSLNQSRLEVAEASIQDGQATVKLSGKLVPGGVCDYPRIAAQIEKTALQVPSVDRVWGFR